MIRRGSQTTHNADLHSANQFQCGGGRLWRIENPCHLRLGLEIQNSEHPFFELKKWANEPAIVWAEAFICRYSS